MTESGSSKNATERITIGTSVGADSGTERIDVERLQLDELVDPFEAKLVVHRDAEGLVEQVAFDLSGLPRIDGMLVGKQALDVPDITKRLCGLCPVVHHLAGVRAVEDLFQIPEIPRPARLLRELLCYGSTLDSLAMKFVATDRKAARLIKSAGQACLRAAGAKSHFPDVAVPGGVREPADPALIAEAMQAVETLLASDLFRSEIEASSEAGAARGESAQSTVDPDSFDGVDIAVVDQDGNLDPLGGYLGIALPDGLKRAYPVAQWPKRARETVPGAAAPRPTFQIGPNDGELDARFYRVGPIARLAVRGERGATPAGAQLILLRDTASRARILLAQPDLRSKHVRDSRAQEHIAKADFEGVRTGVGVVDGPRGLLVHRYTAGAGGAIVDCQIMTPTAQNEYWLTQMLTKVFTGDRSGIEQSIWAADPCLPCSSAPAGLMNFTFADSDADGDAGRHAGGAAG